MTHCPDRFLSVTSGGAAMAACLDLWLRLCWCWCSLSVDLVPVCWVAGKLMSLFGVGGGPGLSIRDIVA